MPADNETDLALLVALREGHDAALNDLMDRWRKPLLSFSYRYVQNEDDARDLVEELFVRVYRNRERFKEDTKFSAWVFTSMANLCRNFDRWRKRHPAFAKDSLTEDWTGKEGKVHPLAVGWMEESPDEMALKRERIELVQAAIEKLPHDLRTTLLLYQYEGMSYREIGDIVGCSVKGIETRLYRARKALKSMLSSRLGASADIWGSSEETA